MTATRCRPPTLRDLSTELTFEVADFCSGSKGEILAASRCFPLFSQQQTIVIACRKSISSRKSERWGSWLRENGLDGINNQERYRALLCLENLQAIERWRDGLDEMQRRRLNHPGAIWAHWQRSLKAEASRQRQHVVATVTAKTAKRGSNIAIRWPARC